MYMYVDTVDVLALALTFIHVAALHRAKRVQIVATNFVVVLIVSPIAVDYSLNLFKI